MGSGSKVMSRTSSCREWDCFVMLETFPGGDRDPRPKCPRIRFVVTRDEPTVRSGEAARTPGTIAAEGGGGGGSGSGDD
ncbi:hypothetical protein O3P69_013775 [Scylla paramamosain]|uniref:Uncharacterized protein n=1 Tax=Scylla paramamosain TaxID=85552 RepID=A0AAW0SQV1_SCYPA